MNETFESNPTQDVPEQNEWTGLTFERQIQHELSLEEKKELIDYFRQRGGRSEFDSYGIFVTDVEGNTAGYLTHEQIISQIPDVVDLGAYHPNGFEVTEGIDYTKSPIAYCSNKTFTYVHFFGSHEPKSSHEIVDELYGRFYLCPEFDQLTAILPKLVAKYQEKDLRLIAKFSKTAERNDRMVLYCDKDSAAGQLAALQELKEENPELFQNLGRNRLWGEIEGVDGIYFGQENPYAHFSYSEDRAMAVGMSAQALDSIVKNGVTVSDEIIEAVFDLATLSRKIDPNSWGEYIKNEDRELMADQAEDILYAINDPEELEYIGDEVDLSKFAQIFSGLRFLLDPEKRKQYINAMKQRQNKIN